MRMAFTIPLLLLATAAMAKPRLHYFSFGPMVHWNFGEGRFQSASYGLEIAWWSYEMSEGSIFGPTPNIEDPKKPGYGLALGFDANRIGCRWYAEPEIGWGLAGFSLGAVVETPFPEGPPRWGFQGSAWANIVLGADIRYRRLGGKGYVAPGFYAKAVSLTTRVRKE